MTPPGDIRTLVLRPATEADREFLLALYAGTRADLAAVPWPEGQLEALLRMQFDAQDADYRRSYPDASFDVVELDGVPVGRLYVDRGAETVRVVDISLLPEQRGRGLGARLLSAVLEEAAQTGRTVALQVEPGNPAARLYDRLGFAPLREDGLRTTMVWSS